MREKEYTEYQQVKSIKYRILFSSPQKYLVLISSRFPEEPLWTERLSCQVVLLWGDKTSQCFLFLPLIYARDSI